MANVICDICGTAYAADVDNCPVCGSSREFALEGGEENSAQAEPVIGSEAAAVEQTESLMDYDTEEADLEEDRADHASSEDDFDDAKEEYREEPASNTGLVVILVILIVLLLLTSGFFFLRYLLPAMAEDSQAAATTVPVLTEALSTTDPRIPCTNLMMDGGKMELGRDGKRLLNVRAYPADTTDVLTYLSNDENVVTVSADGTVTAVGEGKTIIVVTCGDQTINCGVTVDFTVGTETVATEMVPTVQAETAAAVVETTASTETTVPTQTEADKPVLRLRDTEITIYYNHDSIPLELEGDVRPEQVEWYTLNWQVAIVNDGVVTSTGPGTTRVYGEYEGQQVSCLVFCNFS